MYKGKKMLSKMFKKIIILLFSISIIVATSNTYADENIASTTSSFMINPFFDFDSESKSISGLYEGTTTEEFREFFAIEVDLVFHNETGAVYTGEILENSTVTVSYSDLEVVASITNLQLIENMMQRSFKNTSYRLPLDKEDLMSSGVTVEYLGYDNHRGIDFAWSSPENMYRQSVFAVEGGTVAAKTDGCYEGDVSCGGGWGNYVRIKHPDGTSSLYAHLSSIGISLNQTVSQSEYLGKVGNTGYSLGAHLHFEVWENHSYQQRVNPRPYLESASKIVGWHNTYDNQWKYYKGLGAGNYAIGWLTLSANQYYMNGSGIMQTGWIEVSGNKYFMADDGAMKKGWAQIGGLWYYFDEITGIYRDSSSNEKSSDPILLAGDYKGIGLDQTYVLREIDGKLQIIGNSPSHSTESISKYSLIYQDTSKTSMVDINDRAVVGDFNGDGKDDIAIMVDITERYPNSTGASELIVFVSTDTGFKKEVWHTFTSGFPLNRVNQRITAGDFNGDGKDDIAVLYDATVSGTGTSNLYAFISDGSKFKEQLWHTHASGFPLDRVQGRLTSGDYDGDGKDDVAVVYDSTIPNSGNTGSATVFTFLSTGSKFNYYRAHSIDSGFPLSRVGNRVVSGDYDGDGISDISIVYDSTIGSSSGGVYIFTLLSKGNGKDFVLQKWSSIDSGYPLSSVRNRITSGDFDGDGKDDIAFMYRNSPTIETYIRHVFKSTGTDFKYSGPLN